MYAISTRVSYYGWFFVICFVLVMLYQHTYTPSRQKRLHWVCLHQNIKYYSTPSIIIWFDLQNTMLNNWSLFVCHYWCSESYLSPSLLALLDKLISSPSVNLLPPHLQGLFHLLISGQSKYARRQIVTQKKTISIEVRVILVLLFLINMDEVTSKEPWYMFITSQIVPNIYT